MEDFIKKLIDEQGIPADLDEDVRQQIIKDLTERATLMINKALIDAMSEESAEAFGKLMDKSDVTEEEVQTFITEHVPNKDEVAAAALLRFRTLYLGDKEPAK